MGTSPMDEDRVMQDCHKPGGDSCDKSQAQPRPGAPGHHMLPWGCAMIYLFGIYCVRIHPHPGEEVDLATAGKDTMSQRRRGTENKEISRE